MPEVKIAAETRTEFGKGAARRSRREGKVPAVLYGHGTETRHLSLPGHDLMLALKTPNVLLRLEGLKNGSEIALPKAVQRDPVKGFLEHVDLILVRSGEKVTVDVPIRVTGDIAPGDGDARPATRADPGGGRGDEHPAGHRGRHRGHGHRRRDSRQRPQAARRASPCRSSRTRWSCT